MVVDVFDYWDFYCGVWDVVGVFVGYYLDYCGFGFCLCNGVGVLFIGLWCVGICGWIV